MGKLGKIVLIEWADATTGDGGGWASRKKISKQKPTKARSLGFLLTEDDDHITVVASKHGKAVAGDVTIPRGMILSITEMKPVKRRK